MLTGAMRCKHGVEYDYGVLVTFFDFVFFSLFTKKKKTKGTCTGDADFGYAVMFFFFVVFLPLDPLP